MKHLCNGKLIIDSGALIKGEATGCKFKGDPKPPKPKLKKDSSVDTTISKDSCDLPFRRYQPQKSTEEWYFRILKNEIIKQKNK